jgi:hypothetical protein
MVWPATLEVMTLTSDPTSTPHVTSWAQGFVHARFEEAGCNGLAHNHLQLDTFFETLGDLRGQI